MHNKKLKVVLRTSCLFSILVYRAGLKPMQPMQLHWAPRLWGPAPWCLGGLLIFSRYTLRLGMQ